MITTILICGWVALKLAAEVWGATRPFESRCLAPLTRDSTVLLRCCLPLSCRHDKHRYGAAQWRGGSS